MIRWNKFFENTSSRESLMNFAAGGSLAELQHNLWDRDCLAQAYKMRKLRVKKARSRARRVLTLAGCGW